MAEHKAAFYPPELEKEGDMKRKSRCIIVLFSMNPLVYEFTAQQQIA